MNILRVWKEECGIKNYQFKVMKFIEQNIKGVYLIEAKVIEDNRGYFFRTYCDDEFSQIGLNIQWKQSNHSFTRKKGTFRGVHFQTAPFSEYKLIRCIAGAVMDFGVDLRRNSPTLYQHISAELTEDNHQMLLLPPGVGHGFQTLMDNSALIYMHSALYKPDFEGGVFYDDEKIKLPLPLQITEISDRDKNYGLIPDNFDGIDYE